MEFQALKKPTIWRAFFNNDSAINLHFVDCSMNIAYPVYTRQAHFSLASFLANLSNLK